MYLPHVTEVVLHVLNNFLFIDGVATEYDGTDFVWDKYLDDTGSIAVPNVAFKHVSFNFTKFN
jgi:hypothetical protein